MSDLQMLSKAWLGALTPSLASFASSARFTIVDTADSLVVFPATSSDAIVEDNPRFRGQNASVERFSGDRPSRSAVRASSRIWTGTLCEGRKRRMFCLVKKKGKSEGAKAEKGNEYIYGLAKKKKIYTAYRILYIERCSGVSELILTPVVMVSVFDRLRLYKIWLVGILKI